MNTIPELKKEAKALLDKYFPYSEHWKSRTFTAVRSCGDFQSDIMRFLKKYGESPLNLTLEEIGQ